ncbi:MAG: TAXI family TRAP transporter solute-binding subunit [Alphaproteobacteria bacterium]|nr:TAXI family TRAP transporter solute-binding subunit [Alphaproteobacteria bacterium]
MRRVLLAGCAALALSAGSAAANETIRIMTGPQGGSWIPLGGAIENIIKRNVAGSTVSSAPGAGIINVKAVETGKTEIGFGNSISTVDGIEGRAPFEGKTVNVCQLATLYFQYLHLVAPAAAKVNTFADLKGKAIAVQPRGNTAEQATRDLFQVYGLEYKDLSKVNFVSYTDGVALMQDGHVAGATFGTTVPAAAIMDLATARDITLIDVPEDKLAALRKINPGYDRRIIKAGTYPKQTKDNATIGYWAHLIVSCKLPEDTVYKVTKALAENVGELANVVSAVKGLTVKDMALDLGVPLHKGAARFYREAKAIM